MTEETDLPDIDSGKVTERIEATAFALLEEHPRRGCADRFDER